MVSFMWNVKKQNKQNKSHGYGKQSGGARWKRGWGMGKMGEGGQEVQTSSYEMNMTWVCGVKHKCDHSRWYCSTYL